MQLCQIHFKFLFINCMVVYFYMPKFLQEGLNNHRLKRCKRKTIHHIQFLLTGLLSGTIIALNCEDISQNVVQVNSCYKYLVKIEMAKGVLLIMGRKHIWKSEGLVSLNVGAFCTEGTMKGKFRLF